jgi:hypothetical protein
MKGLYLTELKILAGVAIAVLALGALGNFDLADEYERGAMEKVLRPERARRQVFESPEAVRQMSMPLSCPHQWIQHQRDKRPARTTCVTAQRIP